MKQNLPFEGHRKSPVRRTFLGKRLFRSQGEHGGSVLIKKEVLAATFALWS